MSYAKTSRMFTAVFAFLFSALPASAQQVLNTGTTQFGEQTALGDGGQGGLIGIISNIVNIGLGFLAVLVVLYMIYGGFLWMTSGGEVEKVMKAKKTIVNAIVGLVIVLSSWGITVFVLNALTGATGAQNGPGNGGNGGGGGGFDESLGSGSLTNHYPGKNAIGIPRNAPIILTFKDPMQVNTIIEGTDGLKQNAIKIKPVSGTQLQSADVIVTKTSDDKTFTIRPKSPMGSATDVVTYSVELTSAISKADGTAAFGINAYRWNFDVSTVLDLTPPKIQSTFPAKDATQVPRNAVVTVSFDEPIDPTSGTINGAFEVVDLGTGVPVPGVAKYSNGYRTVEFLPSEVCGTSSCGTTVYCMPSGTGSTANIEVRAKPATIDMQLGAPAASLPFDGIADVVGNSLDGNGNGSSQGPSADLFSYRFATNDQVRITPPEIMAIAPASGTQSVAFDAPITITFQPFMQFSTLSANNIVLRSSSPAQPAFWTESVNVDPAIPGADGTTITTIKHGLFAENASYQPEIGSGVRDAYQNCFSPVTGPGCTTTTAKPYCCYQPATGTVVAQSAACSAP